ncbi:hypothetical protein HGB25_01220 [Candidatus Saccharibacteria bacterium]|nr:hypothetical protein [Candidatus Saccharibacteria bacterium]
MKQQVEVIKRGKQHKSESYDRKKLFDSIVITGLSLKLPSGQAEAIADKVCDSVELWLQNRPEVTSDDIRSRASIHLKTHHPDTAYLYEQYHITI